MIWNRICTEVVTETDVAESDTDTAVYVLMRQAGEGNDRKLEQGDYYITDVEKENLAFVASHYRHTVLVVNVGGMIDFGFLDEIPNIGAVVLFVQGGEEGGNALADVLSGKVDFSGKLADTVPTKYEDVPFGDEFSYLNGDLENEYYREGIYVGYRYFGSFNVPVRRPFGFGLSYTRFDVKTTSATLDGTTVKLVAAVTNTGAVPGREVVQIYVTAPRGERDKEFRRLVTFQKTAEIAPGGVETTDLSFDLADCASYCEKCAAWLLDAGNHIVRVGNSSRDTGIAAVIALAETVKTVQCKNCCAETDELPDFKPADRRMELKISDQIPLLTADPAAFETKAVDYTEPETVETEQEAAILDSLTVEEQVECLRGGELQNAPKGALEIHGAGGKTTTALLDKGIRNVVFSDGPAGVNIGNQIHAWADGGFAPAQIPGRYNWGMMAKMMAQRMAQTPGPIVYRYATAWPVEMLLAQTWDTELLREIGAAVGEEMLAFGITMQIFVFNF